MEFDKAALKARVKALPGVMPIRVRQRRLALAYELSRPRRYLLLASHMRSYSTLLGHILSANEEVDGYTEMRRSYRAEADLIALTLQVRASHGGRLRGKIVFDKVLHGGHHIGDEVLHMNNVQVLISVREPHETIRSIVALGRSIAPDNWMAQPREAVKHYVNRLDQLASLSDRIESPTVLAADALMTETDSTLAAVQRVLGLSRPLSSDYKVHAYTGKSEYGDTSDWISAGSVQTKRAGHADIVLSAAHHEQVAEAWNRFWEHIDTNRVDVIGTRPELTPPT